MQLTIRRRILYLLAAILLAFMLASSTLTAPVFADCNNTTSTVCGG